MNTTTESATTENTAVRTSVQRSVTGVFGDEQVHWVGDGFRVKQIIPGSRGIAQRLSPFLMMDYHAPHTYEPTDTPRGVGVHPHRGFETVTLAFEGSVQHHDSTGAGGVINPGDVQWMTAARGILHKEYHEEEWAKRGGVMHMMQLWVNLPAAHKMDDPRYQGLEKSEMGRAAVTDASGATVGEVAIIAGAYNGVSGPAETMTPINLWNVSLDAGASMDMDFPINENAAIFVLRGDATVNGQAAGEQQLVLLENDGTDVSVSTTAGANFVVLNGEPIDEPVFSHGPFVMNTREEIIQAITDLEEGKFGELV